MTPAELRAARLARGLSIEQIVQALEGARGRSSISGWERGVTPIPPAFAALIVAFYRQHPVIPGADARGVPGEWLRAERLARGLSMPALADLVGANGGQISAWERGQNRMTRERAAMLRAVLGRLPVIPAAERLTGDQLRAERLARGISQQQLAEAMGGHRTQSTIADWEAGRHNVPARLAPVIREALESGELLAETEKAKGARGIGPIAVTQRDRNTPTLADHGISKSQSTPRPLRAARTGDRARRTVMPRQQLSTPDAPVPVDLALEPVEPPAEDGELTGDVVRAARLRRRMNCETFGRALAASGVYGDQREAWKVEAGGRAITPALAAAIRAALARFPVIGDPPPTTRLIRADQEARKVVLGQGDYRCLRWREARRLPAAHWAAIRRTLELAEAVEAATVEDLARARAALQGLDTTPVVTFTVSGLPPCLGERTALIMAALDLFRETVERMQRAAPCR